MSKTKVLEKPLRPRATIGILGGGQLGRMLASAAARLGFKTHIYSPKGDNPAFDVATHVTEATYENETALTSFINAVDVVTYEFENVPSETAQFLSVRKPLFPDPNALAVTQDRLKERIFLRDLGAEISPFAAIDSIDALKLEAGKIAGGAVLKTRRFGYDGKGQAKLASADDADAAWDKVGRARSILEHFVPFTKEVSVIVCRDQVGHTRTYAVTENLHENHILAVSRAPADIDPQTAVSARALAVKIADALDYVGVLGVEMFLVERNGDTEILINELAPRVHNSGHWTLDAAVTDQFEQHIRAITGHPLGDTHRIADAEMHNLIGDAAESVGRFLMEPRVKFHHYGKAEAREGRKMGHATRILPLSKR